jgi:hypothetical protein
MDCTSGDRSLYQVITDILNHMLNRSLVCFRRVCDELKHWGFDWPPKDSVAVITQYGSHEGTCIDLSDCSAGPHAEPMYELMSALESDTPRSGASSGTVRAEGSQMIPWPQTARFTCPRQNSKRPLSTCSLSFRFVVTCTHCS